MDDTILSSLARCSNIPKTIFSKRIVDCRLRRDRSGIEDSLNSMCARRHFFKSEDLATDDLLLMEFG